MEISKTFGSCDPDYQPMQTETWLKQRPSKLHSILKFSHLENPDLVRMYSKVPGLKSRLYF